MVGLAIQPAPSMTNLKIIYKNNKPYGIRDDTGFLFFFAPTEKYTDQEERYKNEIMEQFTLASDLLQFLKGRKKNHE